MKRTHFPAFVLLAAMLLLCASCGDTPDHDHDHADDDTTHTDETGGGTDHSHDERPIGTFAIGEYDVEFLQGHGDAEPGKELHLVVKLPFNDNGDTVVRAWIGTDDRTQSIVGKGEYAPSHDDYDIHAMAPDPLPENAMWWVEIERPNGETVVGSAPLLGR